MERSEPPHDAAADARGTAVPVCEVCGNDYDKAMEITVAGATHVFDSFEHAIGPRCDHCGCAIIGHGHEAGGSMYCCAHCAQEQGHAELTDRVR